MRCDAAIREPLELLDSCSLIEEVLNSVFGKYAVTPFYARIDGALSKSSSFALRREKLTSFWMPHYWIIHHCQPSLSLFNSSLSGPSYDHLGRKRR